MGMLASAHKWLEDTIWALLTNVFPDSLSRGRLGQRRHDSAGGVYEETLF